MTNLNKNHKKAFSLVEISIVILIIGLLIAGISKASDMIFDANIASGRSLTKGAKVGRMPSLALWLELTLAESIKDSERYKDSTVTLWRDINPQSTSKFIFKNAGVPKYNPEGQNNMPAIGKFAAATDLFLPYSSELANATVNSNTSDQIFPSGVATIFLVLKPAATVMNLINFCPYTAGETTTACAAGSEVSLGLDADGKLVFKFMSSTTASTTLTSSIAYATNGLIIASAVKDTVGQKLYVNGRDYANAANTYVTTNAFSGAFRVGGTASTGVEIYEIIVFSSALSALDRQSVEAYLGKKYATPMTKTS